MIKKLSLSFLLIFVISLSYTNSLSLTLEYDINYNTLQGVPSTLVFNIYNSITSTAPVVTQSFPSGSWEADYNFKHYKNNVMDIARLKVNFTDTAKLTKDMNLFMELVMTTTTGATVTYPKIAITNDCWSLYKDGMANNKDSLCIIWASQDPEIADKMCFMYALNAKKSNWFKEVMIIVWGPSAKLLSQNSNLQEQVKSMIKNGVIVQACKACSDAYGVSAALQNLGITVKYMGAPLTDMIKAGWNLLSF